jgi:hypothetical protein
MSAASNRAFPFRKFYQRLLSCYPTYVRLIPRENAPTCCAGSGLYVTLGRLRVCPDDLYFEGAIPDCARWGCRTTVSIAKYDGCQHVPDTNDSCFYFLRSYSTLGLTESTRCALRSYPRNRSPLLFAVAEIFQLSVYVLRTRHATTPCIAFCYALHPTITWHCLAP